MADLDAKQRDDMPGSEYAYVDHAGVGHLPIVDEAHVRDALARFDQEHFEDAVCKERARTKILAAAKKFGVDVGKDDPIMQSDDAKAASQPSLSQVHVPAPMGKVSVGYQDDDDDPDDDEDDKKGKKVDSNTGDDQDEEAETRAAEKPSRAFLTRLRELLAPKVAAADLDAAVRGARAHAGGKGKAAMRAMAAGEIADLCARGGPARLFTDAGTLATAPDWIPYLPKPGEYTHPAWGKLAITKARNAHFVENFQHHVYQDRLPIDAEHETKLSGALGWIADMRMNEDGSADAKVEWTDRGRTLLAEKRFRYVSPEWYDKWAAPDTGTVHKDVAIGGALTTRPFFKGESLRPLMASEHGLSTPDAWEDGETPTVVFVELAPAISGEKGLPIVSEPVQGAEEQTRRFAELEAKLAAEQSARAANETALKQASEKIAAMESASRRKRFTDEVMGKGDASATRWFGEPQKHVALLEKLADTFGEDSGEVQQYVEQNRATAELVQQSGLFREIGSDHGSETGSPEAQLDAHARAYQEKHAGVTFEQAYARTFKEHPELQRQIAGGGRIKR